jgi:hypothetical protein
MKGSLNAGEEFHPGNSSWEVAGDEANPDA